MKFFYILLLATLPIFFLNEAKGQTVGANIILNPSFDVNDAGWSHYFDYFWDPTNPLAAKASLSVEPKTGYTGNAYKVSITDAGTADYSVQISYPVALEAGKKYSIKFKASADAARTVVLACQQDVSPKTNWYISAPINLTTTPTVLGPFYYTATTTDPSNSFKFYLGGGGASNGIAAYFDDVEVAEVVDVIGATVPDAPTISIATAGSSKATVTFTAPLNTGGLNIKSYTITSNPGSIKATGAASPVTVNGLTNGQAYSFTVVATNAMGNSMASAPSNAVTPVLVPSVYYVSPGGNDNNNGLSVGSPFATLTKAQASAIAADTIYLMTGDYPPFTINKSGSASGTITYKAYPGDKPLITCDSNGWWSLLQISASFITIDGLEVKGINQSLTLAMGEANYNKILAAKDAGTTPDWQSTTNTNTNGISVGDGTQVFHHITVKNCKVHECSAGGIGSGNADYLLYENNEVFNNGWYCMWATSGIGAIHNISIDSGSNMIIRGNRVYNNYTSVKWISIRAYSDGNGIIIDVQHPEAGYPGYRGKILVENNVVFDNGGRGLYIMSAQNAIFRNNTSYWNSKSWFSDGGEMVVFDSHDITFVNNIGWANPAYSAKNFGIRDDGAWGTNANITWKNNIAFNGTVGNAAVYLNKTTTTSIDGSNKLGVNPLLINPTIVTATANFKLQTASPAIDAGTSAYGVSVYDIEYAARTQGNGIDLGAYEFKDAFTIPPLNLVSFTAKRINISEVEINWNTTQEASIDYYDVERAAVNQSFEKIITIKAKALPQNSYQYIDNNAIEGDSHYRLKMVGKDGNFTYSNVVTLTNGEYENTIGEAYPNPVVDKFVTIDITAKENSSWSVRTVDIAGHTVKLQNADLVKGVNKLKVDLSVLATGIYFLKIENNGKAYIRKAVKY